ncbi:acyl-CoA N-acyltransferase [Coccomyxa subellipsoidea C-169]|uniref:Acyl-CoA N-acyltransferase n=1 Tax=Coccomyxa subellipsoidea (strain C-169) TaxID=574566 RepID=I0YT84_COCSC|nr:acyl-CoA N-acyltransferase [Coccomyxa subellipsoidea C-169]EIE21603.1 acyl-CoA N-acyltransferase [Coccomyxa subellipsoidea C-169]|eukprot:XP_005646147.1 acyl-CoA N-acyltransferase [Coccomyxa subellipsoidea C-169]
MDARVRRATLQDQAVVSQYNIAMAKETEDLELDEKTVQAGVQAILSDPAKGTYFLLEEGGKIVAQLMITYEWSDWRNSQIWWVQSVYVHPDHRRRGLYKALYRHIQTCAAAEKACGVRLYVDVGNNRAQQTYKSLGMTSHYLVFEDMALTNGSSE